MEGYFFLPRALRPSQYKFLVIKGKRELAPLLAPIQTYLMSRQQQELTQDVIVTICLLPLGIFAGTSINPTSPGFCCRERERQGWISPDYLCRTRTHNASSAAQRRHSELEQRARESERGREIGERYAERKRNARSILLLLRLAAAAAS